MWVVMAGLLGMVFAQGLSPLAHLIPWSWEKKAGGLGVYRASCSGSPQVQMLLEKVAKRIYPLDPGDAAFSINVRVARNEAINAYAGLGGNITVNSGLIKQAESPDELAGVLAHEIGHVQHRHIMQGVIEHALTADGVNMILGGRSSAAQWSRYFLNMNFTRAQEMQADEAGFERLQKAHVDNLGYAHFFGRMEKSGSVPVFLSDHPANRARSEMAAKFDNRGATPIMAPGEWRLLKNDCGEN